MDPLIFSSNVRRAFSMVLMRRASSSDFLIGTKYASTDRVARDEVIHRPEGRKRLDRRIGSRRDFHSMIEIRPDRSDPSRADGTPVANQARSRQIKMILDRDESTERIQAGEVLLAREKSVFQGPPPVFNRLFCVRRFVALQNFVDHRVTDSVCADAPPEPVQFFHPFSEPCRRDQLEPTKRPVFSERLHVRVAHVAAFKTSVGDQLHAADLGPFVPLVRAHTRIFNEGANGFAINVGRR